MNIGRAVGIGPMVKIITSKHKDVEYDIPLLFQELNSRKVIIEDGVNIGIGSILLPGVKIGEGSIVGAGSVVTKNVEKYTVVAGVPAKKIRSRRPNEK